MLRILFITLLYSHCAFAQTNAWVSSLHWSPENKLLYSTSYDSSIRVWSVQSGALVHTLRTDQLVMTSVLSRDGNRLITHLSEGYLELWDMIDRKKITTQKIHRSGNFGSWFSADSKTILTGSMDEDNQLTISLWNSATGELIDKSNTYTITNYAVSAGAERYLTLSAANHIIMIVHLLLY
jgi:WD40 repeat protein